MFTLFHAVDVMEGEGNVAAQGEGNEPTPKRLRLVADYESDDEDHLQCSGKGGKVAALTPRDAVIRLLNGPRTWQEALTHRDGPSKSVNGHAQRDSIPRLLRPLVSHVMEWTELPGFEAATNLLWEMLRKECPGFDLQLMLKFIRITGPKNWPSGTCGKYLMIHLLRSMRAVFRAPFFLSDPECNFTVAPDGSRKIITPRCKRWPLLLMSIHVRKGVIILERLGMFTPGCFIRRIRGMLHWFPNRAVSDVTSAGLANDFNLQLFLCAFLKMWPYLACAKLDVLATISPVEWLAVHID